MLAPGITKVLLATDFIMMKISFADTGLCISLFLVSQWPNHNLWYMCNIYIHVSAPLLSKVADCKVTDEPHCQCHSRSILITQLMDVCTSLAPHPKLTCSAITCRNHPKLLTYRPTYESHQCHHWTSLRASCLVWEGVNLTYVPYPSIKTIKERKLGRVLGSNFPCWSWSLKVRAWFTALPSCWVHQTMVQWMHCILFPIILLSHMPILRTAW
jgi:hypothetical protein